MLGRRNGGNEGTRERGNDGSAFRPLLSFLRQLAGMPDYGAHVEHLQRYHPQTPIPSERQFYHDFVRARYQDGPTRCC
jgi:uncharacterized short protein YbdD (DUF466 family)